MSFGRLLLFLLTFLAFAMAMVALVHGPPPLWVPISMGALYFAVIGAGVMNLRLQMFGDAICEVPQAKGKIALTFDDGPDPVSTRHALRLLAAADAHATFFIVGHKADKHPEVIREIVEAGHGLGVHSYGHNRLYSFLPPDVVRQDIERTRDAVERAVGTRPVWFRPPIGQMSPRTAAGVERAHATTIGWNVRSLDGLKSRAPEQVLERIKSHAKDGAIVLMHDAWEHEEVPPGDASLEACPSGVRILQELLVHLRERGLRPVTIDELLEP